TSSARTTSTSAACSPTPSGHPCCLLLRRRPPRPTLFPYTTLFRSPARGLVTADSSRLYVSNFGSNTVAVYDIDNGRVIASLPARSEEHTSELQSPCNLVCRLLLEKKKTQQVRADRAFRRTSGRVFS